MATIEQEREIQKLAEQIAEERGVPHPSLVMTEAYERSFFDDDAADHDPYGGDERCPTMGCKRGWGHDGDCDPQEGADDG